MQGLSRRCDFVNALVNFQVSLKPGNMILITMMMTVTIIISTTTTLTIIEAVRTHKSGQHFEIVILVTTLLHMEGYIWVGGQKLYVILILSVPQRRQGNLCWRKFLRIGKKLPPPTAQWRHPIDRLCGAIREPSGEELKLRSYGWKIRGGVRVPFPLRPSDPNQTRKDKNGRCRNSELPPRVFSVPFLNVWDDNGRSTTSKPGTE